MQDGVRTIKARVAAFMKRKRLFLAGHAAALVGVACLALAGVIICTDVLLPFPSWLRWSAFLLLLGMAVAGMIGRFLVPCLRLRRAVAIREIERKRLELGQKLRTSAQLADMPDVSETGFSRALSEALIAQTEEDMARTDLSVMLPSRTLVRRLALLLGIALVLMAVAMMWRDFRRGAQRLLLPGVDITFTQVSVETSTDIFRRGETVSVTATVTGRPAEQAALQIREENGNWENLNMLPDGHGRFVATVVGREASFEYVVRAGDGRSAARLITFFDPPVVEALHAVLHFPSYTGLASLEVGAGDLTAVEGTRVDFRFQLNHALAEARLRIDDDTVLRPLLEQNLALASYTLTRGEHTFFLEGVDAAGWTLEKVVYSTTGEEDRAPTVRLLEPSNDITVTRITEVPLRVQIRDDYGIAEAGVLMRLDGSETPLKIWQAQGTEQVVSLREELTLMLEEYPLDVRSNLGLYAYARDLKPDRRERSVSELRSVDIRPFRIRYRERSPDENAQEQDTRQDTARELDRMIAEQRQALSDTLKLSEERPADGEEEAAAVAELETRLAQEAREMSAAVDDAAPQDAESPLDRAAENMTTAASELRDGELESAFLNEEQALSDLLSLRQELTEELGAEQSSQPPGQGQDEPAQASDALTSLAREAQRLAEQENEIGEQVAALQDAGQRTPPELPPEQAGAAADPAEADADQPAEARDEAPAEAGPGEAAQAAEPSESGAEAEAPAPGQPEDQTEPQGAELAASTTGPEPEPQPTEDDAQTGEASNPPPAPESQRALQQQTAAVEDAEELQQLLREHRESTPLASERMADAVGVMQQAEQDMMDGALGPAAAELSEAEEKLAQLAEHLRGLDDANVAETIETARQKAEQAADQLSAADETAAAPASESAPGRPDQTPGAEDPHQDPLSRDAREALARSAETVADWLEQIQRPSSAALSPEAKAALAQTRAELGVDELAADMRQAQTLMAQGRAEASERMDRETAARLDELAERLQQQRQQIVEERLEHMAGAQALAQALQEELGTEPAPEAGSQEIPAESGEPALSDSSGQRADGTAARRLQELADELDELEDAELDRLADELRKQAGPFNVSGDTSEGPITPEALGETAVAPVLERLRQLLAETVNQAFLLDRDDRIPDEYMDLTERYFKALSDDLQE